MDKLVCGLGSSTFAVQVLGLGAGKYAGLPVVASVQKSPFAAGNWTPAHQKFTGATTPTTLVDLAICMGTRSTEAVGLGSDGNIYSAGLLASGSAWTLGSGKVPQTTTFAQGGLAASLINSVTVLAVSSAVAPWVATCRDQS